MTTPEFIQKIPEELRLHPLGHCKSLSELVLDPEVWEAVGKKEGWANTQWCNKHRTWNKERNGQCPEWMDKMHGMISALIDGKSLEEYITTL